MNAKAFNRAPVYCCTVQYCTSHFYRERWATQVKGNGIREAPIGKNYKPLPASSTDVLYIIIPGTVQHYTSLPVVCEAFMFSVQYDTHE